MREAPVPMQPRPSPFRSAALVAACLAAASTRAEDAPGIRWPDPDGSLTIARPFAGSEIALRLSRRVAGAVEGLTWGGIAFVDSRDHGGAMQSAAAFGGPGPCRDPQEAGSEADGASNGSASRLLALHHGRAWAETESRMAWRTPPRPGVGDCPPGPDASPVSDVALSKRVSIGLPGIPNAIEVQARFVLPRPEDDAVFTALAATLPAEFSRIWSFDPGTRELHPLSPDAGEQGLPLIFATPEGAHALGVWSPGLPQAGWPDGGYGHAGGAVSPAPGAEAVRWSCTFRTRSAAPGAQDATCYALVGSLADVRAGLAALTASR